MTEQENQNEMKTYKLWYLGIIIILSGSLLIACAVQAVNSSDNARFLWTLFYIFAGVSFFGTNIKAADVLKSHSRDELIGKKGSSE
jgi:predicted membrane channel-forming protein YqfA (hemolysin III family)